MKEPGPPLVPRFCRRQEIERYFFSLGPKDSIMGTRKKQRQPFLIKMYIQESVGFSLDVLNACVLFLALLMYHCSLKAREITANGSLNILVVIVFSCSFHAMYFFFSPFFFGRYSKKRKESLESSRFQQVESNLVKECINKTGGRSLKSLGRHSLHQFWLLGNTFFFLLAV